jgi:hypothetical protein
MTAPELNTLHIIHVTSAIGLVGATFYAFAGAPETRKKVLTWSGIAALLVFLTGLRLWQQVFGFAGGWVYVKMFCWLGIAALAGIAYRRREQAGLLIIITLVLVATAVAMAFVKPF